MEAINEFTFWSLLLVALVLGVVSGFLISYLWLNQDSRARNLHDELERTREELQEYKQKVNQHFQKTAELFEDMTARYREVYRHLASSSEELCGEQPPALQHDPSSQPRLATADPAGADTDTSEQTSDAEARPTRGNGQDDSDMLGDAPYIPDADRPESGSDKPRSKA